MARPRPRLLVSILPLCSLSRSPLTSDDETLTASLADVTSLFHEAGRAHRTAHRTRADPGSQGGSGPRRSAGPGPTAAAWRRAQALLAPGPVRGCLQPAPSPCLSPPRVPPPCLAPADPGPAPAPALQPCWPGARASVHRWLRRTLEKPRRHFIVGLCHHGRKLGGHPRGPAPLPHAASGGPSAVSPATSTRRGRRRRGCFRKNRSVCTPDAVQHIN